MSQFPPNPSFDPQAGYTLAPPPPKTNVPAIISLICGILGCFGITSIAAVILGFIGISQSRKPHSSGKGLAIAGLILGIIGIIGWSTTGVVMYWGVGKVRQIVQAPAANVLSALASGDMASARAQTTSDVSDAQLAAARAALAGVGPYKELSITSISSSSNNGVNSIATTVKAYFANGSKDVDLEFAPDGATFKVSHIQVK